MIDTRPARAAFVAAAFALLILVATLGACMNAPPELNQQLAESAQQLADVGVQLAQAVSAATDAPTGENIAAVAELAAREAALATEVESLRKQVASYGGGPDWGTIGATVAGIVSSVAMSLAGVRAMRGPSKPIPAKDVPTFQQAIASQRPATRREGGLPA